MTEIEFHVLNGQCLYRNISTKEKVETEVEAWQSHRNNKNSKINWQFTCKDARIKLKRLYPSFQVYHNTSSVRLTSIFAIFYPFKFLYF